MADVSSNDSRIIDPKELALSANAPVGTWQHRLVQHIAAREAEIAALRGELDELLRALDKIRHSMDMAMDAKPGWNARRAALARPHQHQSRGHHEMSTTETPEFLTDPGPGTRDVIDFGDDPQRGNIWIGADEFPEAGRVPVQLRSESGESLSVTLSVDGLRAVAEYVAETFPADAEADR